MYFELNCPHCGQRLRLPKTAQGKTAACGTCEGTFETTALKPGGTANPFADHREVQGGSKGELQQPHRGGLILALAIIGIVVCPITSVIAWIMGRTDLKSMARGNMDPSGEGMTKAGTIVALVHCLLMLTAFVVWFVAMGALIVVEVAN